MSLDLLQSVRNRAEAGIPAKGIGTADFYLRQFEQCLDGSCPSQYFKDVSAFRWRKGLESSSRKLVYHHPDMGVDESAFYFGDALKAAAPKFGDLPPHTVAAFNATITTTRQDRDGDILETSGADLDPKATLLYQHMPFEACGRLLKEGKHTNKLLTGSLSLCGTALGEDCAMLAEHGALRISHGFTADDYEPIEGEAGFHILKFKILEVSLVSIPSNPDAEITAFSRDKLHHPFVKALAGVKFDARPVISTVPIDVAALANSLPAGTSVTFSKSADEKSMTEPTACSCKSHKTEREMPSESPVNVKGADAVAAPLRYKGKERDFFNPERATKGVYVEFENSFDDIRGDLNDSLLSYLIANGVADAGDCCYIVDLFLYQAIVQVCSRDYMYGYSYGEDAYTYFMLDWEMGADEEPVWSGAPQAIEITPQITALDKRARSMFVKSMPAKHVRSLSKAMGYCQKVIDSDDATKAVSDLASKAFNAIQSVHADQDGKAFGLSDEHGKKLTKAMGHCSAGAEHADATDALAKHFKSAGTLIKSVMDDSDYGSESLESLIVKAGRKLSAANTAKLKSAAANFKAIADDDEAHKSVAELATKGYSSVKSVFATGGDSGSDFDESGNNTGDDMAAYTATGESANDGGPQDIGKSAGVDGEKAGRAISKKTEATIREAIDHGKGIIAHEKAASEHKSLARKSVSKLKSIIGDKSPDDDTTGGVDDADGSLSLHGGNVLMNDDAGKSLVGLCEKALADGVIEYAISGHFDELERLENFAKRALDTTRLIGQQKKHKAESALIKNALAAIV